MHGIEVNSIIIMLWIICSGSGQLLQTYLLFDRLGQTCNHAAGLIFLVEHANSMGYSACNSMPCSWNVPSEKTSYGPKEVSSMTVKKSQYGKQGLYSYQHIIKIYFSEFYESCLTDHFSLAITSRFIKRKQ